MATPLTRVGEHGAVTASTSLAAEDPALPAVPAIAGMPPLPTGQLLRPAGGGGLSRLCPSRPRARRMLAAGAAQVLDTACTGASPAWSTRAFACRVNVTRRQLAPINGILSLVDSFRREAAHLAGCPRVGVTRKGGRAWEAVQAAYAIRWVELSTGVDLPAWQA